MLLLKIPPLELFNDVTQEFISLKGMTLQLEHSLVSLSKWESRWNKPLLSTEKTDEETVDYIRCMSMTQNVDPLIFRYLPAEAYSKIDTYINEKMTATWFTDHENTKKSREVITAELLYYWMITFNIPMECQKWHLNRLLTLIRVCDVKSQKPKKMSRKDALANRRSLNAARRSKLNSKG